MRTLISIAAVLAIGVSTAVTLRAIPPVPRKSPEFTIIEPSGKQTLLSSAKGKVCAIAFIQTTCPHCQHESQILTKLYKEMGARGFEVFAVAFNENAAMLIPGFIQQFNVAFPVGYTTHEQVESYLGLSVLDNRWVVPQIAIVDRKGMIRAQSDPLGTPNLQEEGYLRSFIDGLLKEGATTTTGSAKKSGRVR